MIRFYLNLCYHSSVYRKVAADRFQVKLGIHHLLNTTTSDAQQSRNITNIIIHEEYYIGFHTVVSYYNPHYRK
jgi:hypothetical protein